VRRSYCSLIAALLLGGSVGTGGAAALELALTKGTATVTDLDPGSSVVLFSVARIPGGFIGRIVPRHEVLEDTDQDGLIELEIEGGVPFRSIWAAVSLDEKRQVALATPAGYPLRQLAPSHPGIGHRLGSGGRSDSLLGPGDFYELLLVRHGAKAAWTGTVYDGNPDDDDGPHNGRVEALLSSLQSLAGDVTPPDRLHPQDTVVGIDPNEMTVFVYSMPGGGRP
jgi:hypothetical protein